MKPVRATVLVAALALTAPAMAATLAPVQNVDTPRATAAAGSSGPGGAEASGRIGSLLTDGAQGTPFADNGSLDQVRDGLVLPYDLFGRPVEVLPFPRGQGKGRN